MKNDMDSTYKNEIERISFMEEIFDKTNKITNDFERVLNDYIDAQKDISILEKYLSGGDWMKDFSLDENGKIPADLKRGVLAEDALFDTLSKNDELVISMKEFVEGSMKEFVEEINENRFEVLRASEEWQRAGAYSVRIEGMNRQHNIPLREEFDEHDTDGTRYIVILDNGYPVATCRFYEAENGKVILGRLVVLPEYRGIHLGSFVVKKAEEWIEELNYKEIVIDSRVEVISFYEKLGYVHMDDTVKKSGNFDCIRMHKLLR
ncbi:MAG: GNAT family N-acetyltransferase [Lachnospiraceae bacterium]|nr:GNAT family N-acetyltransferase [Lachnospiraceae bacterium]